MIKVVPWPIPSLSTLTLPPIFSIKCLQMLNPRPVPYLLHPEGSASFPKFKNNLPIFSRLIPIPESFIRI
jgi:hypothetical protein